MFDKIKKFFENKSENNEDNDEVKTAAGAATGAVINEAVQQSVKSAQRSFAKSNNYDRSVYEDTAAMNAAKRNAFENTHTVKDPYTGKTLYKDQATAKEKYGDNWQEHVAEADHTEPLKKVHEEHKNDAWIKKKDIKDAANSEDNINVVSRKFNNPKRDRTNEEFVEDTEYLKKTGVKLSKKAKQKATEDGDEARNSINRELNIKQAKNLAKTVHEAGLNAAERAASFGATMSVVNNIAAIIKNEKDVETALSDIVKDTGKSATTGYVLGGSLTALNHTLESSSSSFLKYLSKSNVAGNIAVLVLSIGDTLEKYDRGEISTHNCVTAIGETSASLYAMGAGMTVGQVLIPIPIVGKVIGAMVTTAAIHYLVNDLYVNDELLRKNKQIQIQCKQLVEEQRTYQKELREYTDRYFSEAQDAFDWVYQNTQAAIIAGDANAAIKSVNVGTRQYGKTTDFETVDECMEQIMNGDKFVF